MLIINKISTAMHTYTYELRQARSILHFTINQFSGHTCQLENAACQFIR